MDYCLSTFLRHKILSHSRANRDISLNSVLCISSSYTREHSNRERNHRSIFSPVSMHYLSSVDLHIYGLFQRNASPDGHYNYLNPETLGPTIIMSRAWGSTIVVLYYIYT